jgi:putative addiction module component (TIGR02574 family)
MSAHTEAILEQALRLSQEERAEIAREILRSLDDEPPLSDEEWWTAWGPEIGRRLERARSGEDPGVPAEEVYAKAEAKIRAIRRAQ